MAVEGIILNFNTTRLTDGIKNVLLSRLEPPVVGSVGEK